VSRWVQSKPRRQCRRSCRDQIQVLRSQAATDVLRAWAAGAPCPHVNLAEQAAIGWLRRLLHAYVLGLLAFRYVRHVGFHDRRHGGDAIAQPASLTPHPTLSGSPSSRSFSGALAYHWVRYSCRPRPPALTPSAANYYPMATGTAECATKSTLLLQTG
jgi:hypothetical protein